jgi:hypothetical protein
MELMQRRKTQRRKPQRRKTVAMAGALALAAFSAAAALGVNFGLFGLTQPDSRVGRLSDHRAPVTTAHQGDATTVPTDDGRLDDD